MNKIEILLLKILQHNNCTSQLNSMTAFCMSRQENWGLKCDTIYRYLRKLLKNGYLENGLQDGKQKTFYITQKGIRKLEEFENE